MTYFISYIALIINSVRKNKKIDFLIFCVFMWILAGWCYSNADTIVYQMKYLQSHPGTTEWLFDFIISICKKIGLSFEQYRIILTGLFLGILFRTIYINSGNYNIVIALYFIFPFLFDAVQLRQFSANVLGIVALLFLYKHGKKGIPVYLCLCIVGALLHASTLIYVCYIAIAIMNSWIYLFAFSMVISLCIYIFYSAEVVTWICSLFNVSSKSAYMIRLMITSTNIQRRNYLLLYIFSFICFMSLLAYEKKCVCLYQRENSLINFVMKCHIVSLVVVPFIFKGTIDFVRIQFPIMIISYIAFSKVNIVEKSEKNCITKISVKRKNLFFIIMCILTSCCIEYFWIFKNNNFYTVFRSVMDNNMLLK